MANVQSKMNRASYFVPRVACVWRQTHGSGRAAPHTVKPYCHHKKVEIIVQKDLDAGKEKKRIS